MTIGIYLRGILALFTRRTGTFKVTPKEGLDEGGLRVLRMLGLVTFVTFVLLAAWVFRMAAAFGIVEAGPMPELALAITLVLGAWELGCVGIVIGSLVRRRQVRHQFRFPVRLSARIDSTSVVVDVLDITPDGVGFESAVPVAVGHTIELLTRIPDPDNRLVDLSIPVSVTVVPP